MARRHYPRPRIGHDGVVIGHAASLGTGGIAPMVGIESNGDLVSIAAQISAVEVGSVAGLATGGIAGGRLAFPTSLPTLGGLAL